MPLLPENKPMEKDITPKVFFIWGQSMHGKTYLARQFPNPIILNTDGNGKKINTPHVDICDFETFVIALKEIEAGKHTYETVVIDLVDDIKTFLEDYICKKFNVENLADAPFGKAFSEVRSTWKRIMIRLTQLPYTVIFISHIIQVTDEYDKSIQIEQPSLEQKYLNMTKGRTDVMIKCQKIGKTYLQICNEKRDIYKREDFKNKEVLKAIENVTQLFEDNKPKIKELEEKPVKEVKLVSKETASESIEDIKEKVFKNIDSLKTETVKPVIEIAEEETEAISEDIVEIKPLKQKSLLVRNEEE